MKGDILSVTQFLSTTFKVTRRDPENRNRFELYNIRIAKKPANFVDYAYSPTVEVTFRTITNLMWKAECNTNITIRQLLDKISALILISSEFLLLELNDIKLELKNTLDYYNLKDGQVINLVLNYTKQYKVGLLQDVIRLSPSFLDPRFNKDYPIPTRAETFMRGGHTYVKPYGCKRFGIRVLDVFENNDWIAKDGRKGEWMVAYHGTKFDVIDPIILKGLKPGNRNAYGIGVYCTPNLETAKSYAASSIGEIEGKKYLVVIQARANPAKIVKCDGRGGPSDYWYVEKTEDIRTYGLLLCPVSRFLSLVFIIKIF